MRRSLFFVFLVILLSLPVGAMEFSAPEPPPGAAALLPEEADSFGEGLWNVIAEGAKFITPSMNEAVRCCLRLLGAVLLTALVGQLAPGVPKQALELAGVAATAALLLEPSLSMIALGTEAVTELREYGKLLFGVLASVLAAAGGVNASTALYVGTAFFDALLGTAVTAVFLPVLWMLLALSIARAAVGESIIGRLKALFHWLLEWSLKLTLYLFTGYMAVTGVVSGSADAAAGKAARIAISGAVPVVGGILSDAADAVLLSASALGAGAGVWGILTVIALFCAPAVKIGCQYLMLKLTSAIAESLGGGRCGMLIGDFAGAMGLLLALVSTQAVLLLVSSLCFLKGVGG